MRIAYIGQGKMGQSVQSQGLARGHETLFEKTEDNNFDLDLMQKSDLIIECTVPSVVLENIKFCCDHKLDCLVVTTGWYDEIESVKSWVQTSGIRFMYSSNYSIGVNVYCKILESAAQLINRAEEYDIWGHEIHHHNKVDSPSGTAKTMTDILLENIDRKTTVVEDRLERKIEPHEFHFSSTRGGAANFKHVVGFDSEADTIEITHNARNRNGYALGTIKCGEWLAMQPPGFYTMDDYLNSQIFNV